MYYYFYMTFQARVNTVETEKKNRGVTKFWGLREALITKKHEGPFGGSGTKIWFWHWLQDYLSLPKFIVIYLNRVDFNALKYDLMDLAYILYITIKL